MNMQDALLSGCEAVALADPGGKEGVKEGVEVFLCCGQGGT